MGWYGTDGNLLIGRAAWVVVERSLSQRLDRYAFYLCDEFYWSMTWV